MTSPLDDAVRKVANDRAKGAENENRARDRARLADVQLQELVADFCSRMALQGNPGTDWEVKEGLFKKVRGWSLTYESSDAWRRIPVRVDGLVPSRAGGGYVRPEHSGQNLQPVQLGLLAQSMAEVMRRHGVS